MSQLTTFQNKIENRIFSAFGSNITIKTITTSTDKWGDSTTTSTVSTSTTGVPFNYISDTSNYLPFGDLSENNMDMMLRYSEIVTCETSLITYEGADYLVKKVERYPFANGNLALAVRLTKVL